ncbi:hypothetical protein V6Z12_D05G398800 [Gossypium hirsutum]
MACFAFAISSSLFNSFSFAASTSFAIVSASFGAFLASLLSVWGPDLASSFESTGFSGATSGFSSGFLIRPSRLNSRLSRDGRILFS